MISFKNRRKGLHVVGQNPEEETSGISTKRAMLIGGLIGLAGLGLGVVGSEIYRWVGRKKNEDPSPMPQQFMLAPPQHPLAWSPQGNFVPSPSYVPVGQYMPMSNPMAMGTPYVTPMMGLPPAIPSTPVLPAAIPTLAPEPEPLSRTQLAQWQRGLEMWQRDLEDGKSAPRERKDRDR